MKIDNKKCRKDMRFCEWQKLNSITLELSYIEWNLEAVKLNGAWIMIEIVRDF